MCTDGSASKLGNACKAALVQRTATAKAAVVQWQQQQRWQWDSDIAKRVVPAKMTAPEKAAARAQHQQRWQRCSCSTNEVGSKDGSASEDGSIIKGGSASKFSSTTGLATVKKDKGTYCQAFVQGTQSPPTRACHHHHHSTRMPNNPPENHPNHVRGEMASQSDQTSQGSPPFLKFTSASMPPNPTHK